MKRLYKAANSGKSLVLMIVGSWLVAAAVFGLIEGTGLVDSLYWAMTTMSTVGYGDLSAVTAAGKVFTMAFQAWSIFMVVPCAVAHVIDKLRRDEHKLTHHEQEWLFGAVETLAEANNAVLPPQPADQDYKD